MLIHGAGTSLSIALGYVSAGTGYFIASRTSTIRIKENIKIVTPEKAMQDILSLPPVKDFTYITKRKDSLKSVQYNLLDEDRGFIIEDFDQSNFKYVGTIPTVEYENLSDEDDQELINSLSLDNEKYFTRKMWKENALIATLVGAVKYLNNKVEYLESQLAAQ